MKESFWCEECKSFHVDPVDEEHHKQLQCFRPWSDWQSAGVKEVDESRTKPESLTKDAYAQGLRIGREQIADDLNDLLACIDAVLDPKLSHDWRILNNNGAMAFVALQQTAARIKEKHRKGQDEGLPK